MLMHKHRPYTHSQSEKRMCAQTYLGHVETALIWDNSLKMQEMKLYCYWLYQRFDGCFHTNWVLACLKQTQVNLVPCRLSNVKTVITLKCWLKEPQKEVTLIQINSGMVLFGTGQKLWISWFRLNHVVHGSSSFIMQPPVTFCYGTFSANFASKYSCPTAAQLHLQTELFFEIDVSNSNNHQDANGIWIFLTIIFHNTGYSYFSFFFFIQSLSVEAPDTPDH